MAIVRETIPVFPAIQHLKNSIKNKIMRKAIKTALAPIKQAVKSAARARKRTGALATSIADKVKATNTRTYGIVGPKSNYTKRTKYGVVKPSLYAKFLEKGRKGGKTITPKTGNFLVWRDKSGTHFAKKVTLGNAPARPFLRPNFKPARAIETMRQVIESEIKAHR